MVMLQSLDIPVLIDLSFVVKKKVGQFCFAAKELKQREWGKKDSLLPVRQLSFANDVMWKDAGIKYCCFWVWGVCVCVCVWGGKCFWGLLSKRSGRQFA